MVYNIKDSSLKDEGKVSSIVFNIYYLKILCSRLRGNLSSSAWSRDTCVDVRDALITQTARPGMYCIGMRGGAYIASLTAESVSGNAWQLGKEERELNARENGAGRRFMFFFLL